MPGCRWPKAGQPCLQCSVVPTGAVVWGPGLVCGQGADTWDHACPSPRTAHPAPSRPCPLQILLPLSCPEPAFSGPRPAPLLSWSKSSAARRIPRMQASLLSAAWRPHLLPLDPAPAPALHSSPVRPEPPPHSPAPPAQRPGLALGPLRAPHCPSGLARRALWAFLPGKTPPHPSWLAPGVFLSPECPSGSLLSPQRLLLSTGHADWAGSWGGRGALVFYSVFPAIMTGPGTQ